MMALLITAVAVVVVLALLEQTVVRPVRVSAVWVFIKLNLLLSASLVTLRVVVEAVTITAAVEVLVPLVALVVGVMEVLSLQLPNEMGRQTLVVVVVVMALRSKLAVLAALASLSSVTQFKE
tara:strand:+ start:646 stop:1011 length:366 start_codon:yes stop_codon:yes gene_type:complete